MSEMKSPLARLVVFMVFLSIAGALLAGVQYLVVEKSLQDAAKPPSNAYSDCSDDCYSSYVSCKRWGTPEECEWELTQCRTGCYFEYEHR